jgi:hypothetical protein
VCLLLVLLLSGVLRHLVIVHGEVQLRRELHLLESSFGLAAPMHAERDTQPQQQTAV